MAIADGAGAVRARAASGRAAVALRASTRAVRIRVDTAPEAIVREVTVPATSTTMTARAAKSVVPRTGMAKGPSADADTTGSTATIADIDMTVRMVTAASAGIPTVTATAVGRMATVHVATFIPTGMADMGIVIVTTTAVGRGMATSGMTVTVIVARVSTGTAVGMTTGGLTVGRMSGPVGIAPGTTAPVMTVHVMTVHMGIVPTATAPMATAPVMIIVKAAIGATVPVATGIRASMAVMTVVVTLIAMTTAGGPISVTARMAMTVVVVTLTGPSPTPRRTPIRIVGLASPRCPRVWNGPCFPRMIVYACVD